MILKDADAVTSNQYNVRLIGDISHALRITYDTLPIEHPQYPDQAPYTAIVPSEYRALVRRCPYFAFQLIFYGCPRVYLLHLWLKIYLTFSRILRQKDTATEIAVSCGSSGYGWISSRRIWSKFGESVSILRRRHSLANCLIHSLHLQKCPRIVAKCLNLT